MKLTKARKNKIQDLGLGKNGIERGKGGGGVVVGGFEIDEWSVDWGAYLSCNQQALHNARRIA